MTRPEARADTAIMDSQSIRRAFLDFFAARGHKVVPSSSLIPRGDPTLLFTNAGMNQFKNTFLGLESRGYTRAASVQKCMRVSGKHNDLDTVGRTPKHHTFFEMLGNFSFGDYFKAEAVAFAWELMTGTFRLPPDRLYVTVFHEDDAAFELWNREIGVPGDRIFRFGKSDNFWAMGDTGPCGPCSEIHYDFGADIEAGAPEALIASGSARFSELWNLVFMEFFQDEQGTLTPLPAPSIDTGMGLERLAAVLQGRRSNFDTDLFRPLIEAVCASARREYPAGDEGDVSVRVVADHVRAAAFLIGDGVTPANEGRGYVLRRIIRRAFRHGNLLGLDKPFLYQLTGRVADLMKDAYPELLASNPYIARVCLAEEERFAATLASGLRYFEQFAEEAAAAGRPDIPGSRAFKLYDTFGFPLDLTQDLAAERGLGVDEAGFARELESQRDRARQAWKGDARRKERLAYERLKGRRVRPLWHEGVEAAETEVLAVVRDGSEVERLDAGESGEVVLAESPFYAEAGGQIGESGILKGVGVSALVGNSFFATPDIIAHDVKVLAGSLRPGDRVEARPDLEGRAAIAANHTATHLLHAALRQILGDHVKQAGSLVSAHRLRFDFTHFAAVTPEELRRVESLVNARIRDDLPVETRETTLEEGIQAGATAIFEEKYGETVRVVRAGDFSLELCGGIHVRATGRIGLFKIVSEASVAAGMRRIEAVTGDEAFRWLQGLEDTVSGLERSLGVPRRELDARVDRLKDALDKAEREIKALRRKLVEGGEAPSGERVWTVRGISLMINRLDALSAAELRETADRLKARLGSGVVVLGARAEDKAQVVVSVTKDLAGRIRADVLAKALAARMGGGGGGRPDFAQAGGAGEALESALDGAPELLESILGGT